MEFNLESIPLRGSSPDSMSLSAEKYVQKEQALMVRKEMMGIPTSLAISMVKLIIPSAMMQLRSEYRCEGGGGVGYIRS